MAQFNIEDAKNDQYYWNLVASNGETLCHSETYTTKQSCKNGIEAVKRVVPKAAVVDNTRTRSR